MFKNFSAKNLACRKTKTDDLSVPATERSNPTASTDGAAVLPCLHTELTGLQMDHSAPDPAKAHEISFAELYFC